jgi:pyruvyl transferase EpsI
MIKAILKPVLPLLRVIKHRRRFSREVSSLPKKEGRRFILLGSPTHGNLGDHAIAVAQRMCVNDLYPGTAVCELTEDALIYASKRVFRQAVTEEDVLILRGGGDVGTIWGADRTRYRMLRLFPNNKFILFPQSVYFEDTPKGRRAAARAERLYGGHRDLLMSARDRITYGYMKERYPKVTLTPDIVLYMDKQQPKQERAGALLVLRSDAERRLPGDMASELKVMLVPYYGDVWLTDTVLRGAVPLSEREAALEKKLDEFRGAELVLTDRLHGMVFAAITATPCIAFPNSYHKMEGLYGWLENIPYIRFARGLSEVPSHIEELRRLESPVYDPAPFRELFAPLFQALQP